MFGVHKVQCCRNVPVSILLQSAGSRIMKMKQFVRFKN